MILNGYFYQDGDYWVEYVERDKVFLVGKDGLVCSRIIGSSKSFTEAKEMIEKFKMGEE